MKSIRFLKNVLFSNCSDSSSVGELFGFRQFTKCTFFKSKNKAERDKAFEGIIVSLQMNIKLQNKYFD